MVILNKKVEFGKKRRAFARKIIYSRVVFSFFLILVQIVLFFLFILEFKPYTEAFLGTSLLLSFLFLAYLANCKGRNEYKLAWTLPLIIFPLFGIAAYIMYHTNRGGRKFRKRLNFVKNQTKKFQPEPNVTEKILSNYPDIKSLGKFLYSTSDYHSYSHTVTKYFPNGETYFAELLKDLESAKKYIFIEYFIIDDDQSWGKILEILERKVLQGVEVRVLYDAIGSITVATKKYQKFLKSKGINSHIFLRLIPIFSSKINNRNHRKILVIDGKIAYTGGINLTNEYFNVGKNRFNYWKDTGLKIMGPAIRTFVSLFLQDWNLEAAEKDVFANYLDCNFTKKDSSGLVIPYGDDAFNGEDIAENVYLYFISTATKYVYITTPYLLLDNQMINTLIFAAKRGIDVRIIVPSVPDHLITFSVGKTYIKNMIDNGVKVYTYQKGFIHAKNLVTDDNIATVGSVNLDYRSFFHHFECGTILYETETIKDIYTDFMETLKDCELVTEATYKKIPKFYRFIGRIFRIFAPLM